MFCLFFRHSVLSNSLRPPCIAALRLPSPSLSPGVCLKSCQLSQWCHPTISPSVALYSPSIFPRNRVFSNESVFHIRWPNYYSISCSIEYLRLIPFRVDLFDLLAVQGTLKSVLQHTVQKHQFFEVQPSLWSNYHICTWLPEKTALTRQTFVGKVMSLLFNMLSRLVITFLPRSKHILILWLQSPSTVVTFWSPRKLLTLCLKCPCINSLVSYLFIIWKGIPKLLFLSI